MEQQQPQNEFAYTLRQLQSLKEQLDQIQQEKRQQVQNDNNNNNKLNFEDMEIYKKLCNKFDDEAANEKDIEKHFIVLLKREHTDWQQRYQTLENKTNWQIEIKEAEITALEREKHNLGMTIQKLHKDIGELKAKEQRMANMLKNLNVERDELKTSTSSFKRKRERCDDIQKQARRVISQMREMVNTNIPKIQQELHTLAQQTEEDDDDERED